VLSAQAQGAALPPQPGSTQLALTALALMMIAYSICEHMHM